MVIYALLWTHCKHLCKSQHCLFSECTFKICCETPATLRFLVLEFELKQYAEDLLEATLQQSRAEHSLCQTVESALGVFLAIKHGYDMQKHVYKSTSVSKLSGYMDAHTLRSQRGAGSPLGYLRAK